MKRGVLKFSFIAVIFSLGSSLAIGQLNFKQLLNKPAQPAPDKNKQASTTDRTHKWQLGGSINGEFSSGNDGSSSNFGASGTAGYFLTNDLMVGAQAGVQLVTGANQLDVGVLGRYYFNRIFASVGINEGFVISKDAGNSSLTFGTGEIGYSYPLNEKVNLEAAAQINIPISPSGGDPTYGLRIGAMYNF